MATHASFDHQPLARPRIAILSASPALEAMLAPALDALGLVSTTADHDAASDQRAEIMLWDGPPGDGRIAEDLLAAAAKGMVRLIIAAPFDTIDAWGFAVGRPGAELVPDRDPEALIRAIARWPARSGSLAREGAVEDPIARLRELGTEVTRIAKALDALGSAGGVADRRGGYRGEASGGPPILPAAIRAMIRARRARDQFFVAELFADPAWDILLDLMAAHLEGREVAVSSLCIAAAVPPTTALRWISTMTEQGLLVRVADPEDRRRVFIRLSADTAERMEACLAALARGGAPVA